MIMNSKNSRIKTRLIIFILLSAALVIRLGNVKNHFSFMCWDAGWYYLNAQGFYKMISLFFIRFSDLIKYIFFHENQDGFLSYLNQFKGEAFTLEFIKPFYVLLNSFLFFFFPAQWHFFIPLVLNIVLSLLTIISGYLISRQLEPIIKNHLIIPIFIAFSGINIYFSHNSVSTNTATFLFSLLILFSLKELDKDRHSNQIVAGALLALLPATHEVLIILVPIYFLICSSFYLFKRILLKGLLRIIFAFLFVSFIFQFISIARAYVIRAFAGREVLTYLWHFFNHYDLNSNYNLPFPQYSLAYFKNSFYVFFQLINVYEGVLFSIFYIFSALILFLILRKKALNPKVIFVYLITFLPAICLIFSGFILDRGMGFNIFAASITITILLEQLFSHKKAVYAFVVCIMAFNYSNLCSIVSIKIPYLEVASEIRRQFDNRNPPEKVILDFSLPELEVFTKNMGLKDKIIYLRAIPPPVNQDYYRQYYSGVSSGIIGIPVTELLEKRRFEIIRFLQAKGYQVEPIRVFKNNLFQHPNLKYGAVLAKKQLVRMAAFDDYVLYRFTKNAN